MKFIEEPNAHCGQERSLSSIKYALCSGIFTDNQQCKNRKFVTFALS